MDSNRRQFLAACLGLLASSGLKFAEPAEDLLLSVEDVVEFLASALLPMQRDEREKVIEQIKHFDRGIYMAVVRRLLMKMHAIIKDAEAARAEA